MKRNRLKGLSPAQRQGLQWVCDSKTLFRTLDEWLNCGHSAPVLLALKRRGFVTLARCDEAMNACDLWHWSPGGVREEMFVSIALTDAGRTALAAEERRIAFAVARQDEIRRSIASNDGKPRMLPGLLRLAALLGG